MKLHTFDKELPHGDGLEIKLMQVASRVLANIVLVAIGGKVFKYDLATKQCLFEFKTFNPVEKKVTTGRETSKSTKTKMYNPVNMLLYD